MAWYVFRTILDMQCLSCYNSGYCCYYYYYFTKPSRWQFENLCRKSEPVRIRAGTSNQSTPTTQREEEDDDDDDNDNNFILKNDDNNNNNKNVDNFSNFFYPKIGTGLYRKNGPVVHKGESPIEN